MVRRLAVTVMTAGWMAGAAMGQPPGDDCLSAVPLGLGATEGTTTAATADGAASCDLEAGVPDVWFALTAEETGRYFVEAPSSPPLILSAHPSCGAVDSSCSQAVPIVDQAAIVGVDLDEGETVLVRVARVEEFGGPSPGPFSLYVGRGGRVEGTVRDAEGTPLGDVHVLLYGGGTRAGQTAADGTYAFEDVSPGLWTVLAGRDSAYRAEIWQDRPCPHWQADCLPGDRFEVALDATTSGIDFALELGAAIEGRVVDRDSGTGIAGVPMTLGGDLERIVVTDESGRYRFEGLETGTYTVRSDIAEDYRSEIWDDASCWPFGCAFAEATPIQVVLGATAPGIDFELDRGASISGRVLRESDGGAVAFETVHLLDHSGSFLALARTRDDGSYRFERLDPGSYLVRTATDTYVDEIWPDVPCGLGGSCETDAGSLVSTDLDAPVEAVDFDLVPGAVLTARVRDAETGASLSGPLVHLFDAGGEPVTVGFGGGSGDVRIGGLVGGTYFAVAEDSGDLRETELYRDVPCPDGDCGVLAGTPIELVTGAETEIVFDLDRRTDRCVPDDRTVCLNDGRFGVRAAWATSSGGVGDGRPIDLPGREDSGAFWFFQPSNVEVVVKVLDGCWWNERFWVFSTGLTNVEVDLTVTDYATGQIREFHNPQGRRYLPVLDTEAFATCGIEPRVSSDGSGALGDAASLVAAEAGDDAFEAHGSGEDHGLGRDAPCSPSSGALCLGADGRFRVQATWAVPGLAPLPAVAVPLVEDTGLFWFFDPSNLEVVVKVLDGCEGLNERFWIFAAGLTDVEVELRVTDTRTGDERVYRNPAGTRFLPVQDVDAFATCGE